MSEEAYPEAAEVLRAAGWAPHNGWGVYTRGTMVMGHPAPGEFRLKDFAAIPPGHPQYSADTPDTALEAALWLVAKERKPPPIVGDIVDTGLPNNIWQVEPEPVDEVPEPVREESGNPPDETPGVVDSGDQDAAGGNAGGAEDGAAGGGADLLAGDGSDGAGDSDVLDAEYDEPEDDRDLLALEPPPEPALEGADADFAALPPPEPEDFAPDEIAPDEVAEAVAIFGDNLPMQRLLLIGRVTQIAGELKAVLQDGWTVDEFRELQNHIMRMSEGLAPDDEHARARFAAISEASRAMSMIDAHAERQVEWINGASRDEIATYKPEENWP